MRRSALPRRRSWRPCRPVSPGSRGPWAVWAVSRPTSSTTVPIRGTGEYYYDDPRFVGLITLEDLLVQIDELGIEHGYDVDRVLWLGKKMEKTLRAQAPLRGHLSTAARRRAAILSLAARASRS